MSDVRGPFWVEELGAYVEVGFNDEDDDDAQEGDWDDWEEAEANCGRIQGGICMSAGSEYCDFECPFRDLLK